MVEAPAKQLIRYLLSLTGPKCRLLLLVSLTVSGVANGTDNSESLTTALKVFSHDGSVPIFKYALFDLDGDRQLDAVVILSGPEWCGSGGCTMVVMQGTRAGFKFISKSTITNEPIRVLRERRHGWRTLVVNTQPAGAFLMRFNGRRYPSNPSMQLPCNVQPPAGMQSLTMIAGNTPAAPLPLMSVTEKVFD